MRTSRGSMRRRNGPSQKPCGSRRRARSRRPPTSTPTSMPELPYREALRTTLIEEMDRDRAVVLLGEDIGLYQGTFRVTADLLDRYGPTRVIDTPISELGFVGAAVGMAMLGLRPVVDGVTWDLATPAEARGLLRTAIRGKDPVIFLENAALYGLKGEVPNGAFALPFGQAEVARAGRDGTLAAHSPLP